MLLKRLKRLWELSGSDDSFKWTGWVKPQNQSSPMRMVYPENMAQIVKTHEPDPVEEITSQ